jgi:carboxyl-terminal processing protease
MRNRFFAFLIAIAVSLLLFTARGRTETSRSEVVIALSEALATIEGHYAGHLDRAMLTKAALAEMLRTLDPHCVFYDQTEWSNLQPHLRSEYYGIGVFVVSHAGRPFVQVVLTDSPADRAGLRYGDEILRINDVATSGKSLDEVRSLIKGDVDTSLRLSYQRPGAAVQTIEVVRQAISTPSVANAYLVAPGVGYIQHNGGFTETSSDEMENVLASLQEKGLRALIIDLRGNSGGFLSQVTRVASMFLAEGQNIYTVRGRAGNGGAQAEPGGLTDIPLVLLIDRDTISAAEIFSGALQDHDRALIIGQRSFGKGLVQKIYDLGPGNGAVRLTTSRYYTPSGRSVQRDYSKTSYRQYISGRGSGPTSPPEEQPYRTDTGRPIGAGEGINPDIEVAVSPGGRQRLRKKWDEALFGFTAEVVNGRMPGLESFAVSRAVAGHVLSTKELLISDDYIARFKQYLTSHPDLHAAPAEFDARAESLRIELRRELVMAHFGFDTAAQIDLADDACIRRAIEELPQATRMAERFRKRLESTR